MKIKAFALIELLLATILGMLVMLGSVGVLENMQRESANFQRRVSEDMNWVEANCHLAQMVRSSSYLNIPDANTLELHNYDGSIKGTYRTATGEIRYTNGTIGPVTIFKRINATFGAPAAPKGRSPDGKIIEANVECTLNYTAPSTAPFTSAISLSCRTAVAPPASSTWARIFGGAAYDCVNSIQKTSDGGYIMGGATMSFGAGGSDFYLIKTGASGNTQWSKTFGGPSNDYAYSVQQTSDGGYIMAGATASFGAGICDAYLVKTDSSGNAQWSKTFGGASYDYAYSVQQTSDGGYIMGGYTMSFGAGNSDAYLIKTNSSGVLQWSKPFGGASADYAYSVQQTSDGGYIMAGWESSFGAGSSDLYLIKTNSNGGAQWSKPFGGAGSDYAYSVQQMNDGGYIIAGSTKSLGAGGGDAYLIKTDSSGIAQWSNTFGGASSDYVYSVQQTSDGGYIMAGATKSFGAGVVDVYLVKTDSNGNLQWSNAFGGASSDAAYSVQQASDGGYLIAGYTDSFGAGDVDVYLIKTDSNGNCPEASNPVRETAVPQ